MSSEGFLEDVEEDEVQDVEVVEEESSEQQGTKPAPVPDSDNTLVQPVDDIDAVVDLYDRFDEIKEKLIEDEDIQIIQGNKHVTKSGWRKIATAFNLSIDVINKEKELEDGILTWRVEARAIAPNGKTATSWSACASNESNHMDSFKQGREAAKERDDVFSVDGKMRRLKEPREVNEHNILSTAETRAKNRAISDLVGGGSISAEEIGKEDVLE